MRVAISGAGIAGPALAYWLLRTGHQPTLIEAAPRLRTGGYMIDFWGTGFTVAERMGLLPAVRAAGYRVGEVRFVDARGRKAGGLGTGDLFRRLLGDRFVSLPRGDLARVVYGALDPRTEALFGDSIAAIAQYDDGVRLTLASGGTLKVDLLVGADGLHSRVRELAFGPEPLFERQVGYYVAAFDVSGYRPRDELVYVSHAAPGRQVARFAQRDDRTLFLFVFVADRLPGAEPSDLAGRRATLRQVFGDCGWETSAILARADRAEEIYFDRVSQIDMPAWSKGRIALIGDAGASVSLLAGEGSGLALVEAYCLAGELARAGGDHALAFERHERRLRPLIRGKQDVARRFGSSFAPRTALGIWFRNQMTRAMNLPGVGALMMGRLLRDDFELPDYGM
jgi:2-polyprenyl-6-methoxyphenol hydroxylase-like FAD-dependent oxidoreductase